MPRLSPRLRAVLQLVPRGDSMADIGCDHAHLAIAAARQGSPSCIAIDIAAQPLAVAKRAIEQADLGHRVQLRLGDGLSPLRPGEVDGVVIAGVGGRTCVRILDNQPPNQPLRDLGLTWLVLQVNRDLPDVRKWLAAHDWLIERETLVRAGRRIFVSLRATPRGVSRDPSRESAQEPAPRQLTAAEAYLGRLRQDADPVLHVELLTQQAAKLQTELKGLLRAARDDAEQRALLTERRAWLSAVQTALATPTMRQNGGSNRDTSTTPWR